MTPTYTFDWFSNNIPFLTKHLGTFAGRDGVSMLEIGCFEGLSTRWFLDNILTGVDSHITCVDTFGGSTEHAGINLSELEQRCRANLEPYAGRCVINTQSSLEFFQELYPFGYQQTDLIYVDGSHEVRDVCLDGFLAFRLLKPGGIMVFDDYSWGGHLPEGERTKVGIDAFLATHAGHLMVLGMDYQVAIQKLSN